MDLFYGLKTTSIEERVTVFSKGPKFERDDLEAHINLITEPKALKLEAEGDNIEEQLDRPDIVRDIIGCRISYLKDSFFVKETKMSINKFVYTKAQSRVIGQEQLCPKIMKKMKFWTFWTFLKI